MAKIDINLASSERVAINNMPSRVSFRPGCGVFDLHDAIKLIFRVFTIKPEFAEEMNDDELDEIPLSHFNFEFYDDVVLEDLTINPANPLCLFIFDYRPKIAFFSSSRGYDPAATPGFLVHPDDTEFDGLVIYQTKEKQDRQILDPAMMMVAQKKYESLVAKGRITAGFVLTL
jgi:hypothetical protein